jgi:argininosuccinate lyase
MTLSPTLRRPLRLLLLAAAASAAAAPPAPDAFQRLSQINKASIVMLAETGLVPRPLAGQIAGGIRTVIAGEGRPGAKRSGDYLEFEALLVKAAGPDASRLHTGRSRQDIGSTSSRMQLREALLATFERALEPRRKLLDLAAKHVDTVVPAYTHGLQAQPISLAHYLLAFASAFERDCERLSQAYPRINQSPLGAAALATSGFPLDRKRLAALLGFNGVVENSLDANQVSGMDAQTELASVLAISALHVGQFVQDIHIQYSDPVPWITLEPSLTHPSSIMPQKRNPNLLEPLRILASSVVSDAQAALLVAHNTSTGMNDPKNASESLETARRARQMYDMYAALVGGLVVDADRALAEVDADYSTMTEVADTLLREAQVPFRIGHHYASEITTYGRQHGKKPKDLTDAEFERIYQQADGGQKLPVPASSIRSALNAQDVVRNRKGLGGTQPAEVRRMLEERKLALASSRTWLDGRRNDLKQAEERLEAAFQGLAGGAPAGR